MKLLIVLFLLLVWNNNTIAADQFSLPLKENTKYIIRKHIDLKGQKVVVPEGCTFIFKGGRLINGTIVFNRTALHGSVLIDTEVAGSISNTLLYGEWFGARPGSGMDASIGINKALKLARATGATVKLKKGKYLLKGHLGLNGAPVGLDTTRYVDHNNLTLEGAGKKTILVNMCKADVINLGYCKNIKIRNLSVINDKSLEGQVRRQKKSGVNLCSIVNAINVEVSGLYLSHGVYYPHTKKESGVEYFDGGKGLTIQGSLFENIYVSDCVVEDCIYGLDVTTSYPFFQNRKSKITVERITVENCYRGCVITGGGNRDESLYYITKGLIKLDDITIRNCFQSICTQQSVATTATIKVVNTKTIEKLAKRPGINETWLIKPSDAFSKMMAYSWVFNSSQSIGCDFNIHASVINTNYALMVQGSYSQSGKHFFHRNSSIEMTINDDFLIVPKLGNNSLSEEQAVYYIKNHENIEPHINNCRFILKGFNSKNNTVLIPQELNKEVLDTEWIIK